jgi:hypothetical protein
MNARLMQLREMSKKQKLLIIVVAAVIGLLFYANLVALNLIAVSQLSMYGAAAAAGALTVVAVILSFVGKQKSVVPKTVVKPVVQSIKVEKSVPNVVERPVTVEKTSRTVNAETRNSYLQSKQATVQAIKQPSVQPKEQSTIQFERKPMASPILKNSHFEKPVSSSQQPKVVKTDSYLQARQPTVQPVKSQSTPIREESTVKDSYIDKPVLSPKEPRDSKNGKLKCQSCGKEFSQPILMAGYSNPDQPDLVPHCPYCFKPLNSQLEVTTEEIAYKKYV